jgi:hypothetical protein
MRPAAHQNNDEAMVFDTSIVVGLMLTTSLNDLQQEIQFVFNPRSGYP